MEVLLRQIRPWILSISTSINLLFNFFIMKYLKISPMVLAVLAFTACSNDNDVVTSSSLMEKGGSVRVSIQLPQISSTRSTLSGYNDGDANEYNVESADMALYAIESSDTVCVGTEHFTKEQLQFAKSGTNLDAVTSVSAVVTIPANATTPTLALAILNDCDGHTVPTIGSKYSDFEKNPVTATATGILHGNFMMTNSTFENGTVSQSLAPIDPKSISSNVGVKATTTTTIYVERVNAKVELSMPLTSEGTYGTYVVPDVTTQLPTITFSNGDILAVTGWDLTVTNKSYYPVKVVGTDNATDWSKDIKYQMATLWNDATNHRSYWAVDPNYYNTTVPVLKGMGSDFNYKTTQEITSGLSATTSDNIKYCLENTFNVSGQNKNQTTAVIIKGAYTLNGVAAGSDLYRISGTVYSLSGIQTYLAERLAANGYTVDGTTPIVASSITIVNNTATNLLTVGYSANANNVMKGGTGGTPKNINDAIIAIYGTNKRAISFYPKGECFYSVQIKNFGDDIKLYNPDGTDFVYKNDNNLHGINSSDKLGRYGVVRNTWYKISINSISGIGASVPEDPTQPINPDPNYPDPTDPTPDPTPDDTNNYYINAQINILPWAVRTQGADL